MDKKLNILVFKFAMVLGGGERFSFLVAEKMGNLGHRVRVYTNSRGLFQKIKKAGLSVKRIYWGHEVGARRYLPIYFLLLPINIVRFSFIFFSNRKKGSINIAIFQNLNEKIFATPIAKAMGYKVFWVEHLSIDPWLTNNHFRNKYLRRAELVNKIITVSGFIKEELVNLGLSQEKIEVVYNGVDLKEFKIDNLVTIENEKKKHGFFKGAKIIGYAGRLHSEKGIDTLIGSFSQLIRRFDHLYLLIVGDGSQRAELERKVHQLSLEKRIIFIGHVENISLFMNMLDILVLPSRTREAFGMVLIEAMSCGKVVFGSNLGGIPEIIQNEENGFLFAPGIEKELTDKLSRVLSDDDLYRRISKNAISDVNKRFNIEIMIKRLEEVMRK